MALVNVARLMHARAAAQSMFLGGRFGVRRCSSSAAGSSEEQQSDEQGAHFAVVNEKSKVRSKKQEKERKKEEEERRLQGDTAAKLTIQIKTAIREFKLGPIPNAKMCGLPTKRSLITVIRGPHIDKKSREQFDIQTRKWEVRISTTTSKLREKLDFLKQHRVPGVEIKAKFQYRTRLNWPLKPTHLSDSDKWKLYNLRNEDPDVYTAARLAQDFQIEEQQVYDVMRSMEERNKHLERFG